MSELSDKELDYWRQMVELFFDQFDEKSGSVGGTEIYKPSEQAKLACVAPIG